MNGTQIVLSSEPRGVFKEGTISGALLPGTVVEIVPGSANVNDEFVWRAYSPASGTRAMTAVLRADELQGKTAADAYVDGSRCFLYVPAPGEELNVLLAGVGAHTVGEQLMVQQGTGMLITAAGTAPYSPFTCLEAIPTALAVPTLTWCVFNG